MAVVRRTIDPRIPPMPVRSTPGFNRPGRHLGGGGERSGAQRTGAFRGFVLASSPRVSSGAVGVVSLALSC